VRGRDVLESGRERAGGVPLGVRLHPTQLYEAFAEFAIFGILYTRAAKRTRRRYHQPLYSAVRGGAFVVEFFRFHEQGNLWGGPLDTSQWISLALMAAGAAHFVAGERRSRRSAADRVALLQRVPRMSLKAFPSGSW